MAEDYTIEGYLGTDYQLKFLWQILTEPDFANQTFQFLSVDYWDNPNYKRYFIVIREYFNEYGKVPNLQNKSIYHAITKYKLPNDSTDEEILLSITEQIKIWNERILNKELDFDGDHIQKAVFSFIKQGEYADLANFIVGKLKNGQLKDDTLVSIEDRIKKISQIGVEEDDGVEVFENIDTALQREFRNPIPTGIAEIDTLMGGGLGRGEIGIVLAPSGVGKSTILTIFANTAHMMEKNVLQIIFEDTPDQIRRKHYAIWSDTKLSEMKTDTQLAHVREGVVDYYEDNKENLGKLVIKRFPQDETTIPKIRTWIDRYRKKTGIKFDVVILDYIDCVEPHKKSVDQNQAELSIIKSFESMAGEYDIPCWTAIQTNRSGFGSEFVDHGQMGGSIKRAQKTHFLMSVAKTDDQKEAGLANIKILKARFAQDGQRFEDIIFNNDAVEVVINHENRRSRRPELEEGTSVDDFNNSLENIDVATSEVNTDSEVSNQREIDEQPKLNTQHLMSKLGSDIELNDGEKDNVSAMLDKMAENQNVIKKD